MNTTIQYAGIDYGSGQTNRDKTTGIRYGVIPQNEVLTAWCDSSEPHYGKPHCPDCGNEAVEKPEHDDYRMLNAHCCGDLACDNCRIMFDADSAYPDEPLSHYYDRDGYQAQCGDDGDIFILKSPYFTYAQFCSPCAPGACYLLHPLSEPMPSNRAYCFGHDWFEDNKAPYPVYSVATGELVQPD